MALGTIAAPITFTAACKNTYILPGHRVWLRGGVYRGNWSWTVAGTEASPLLIRPYPGELVVIDGTLDIYGGYTDWRGFVFRHDGWTTRETEETGPDPTNLPDVSVNVYGHGIVVAHNVFHDLRQVSSFSQATGSVFYGNVIYHMGWLSDREHGPAYYAQNDTSERLIKHNICWSGFRNGIQLGGTNLMANTFHVIENAFINTGQLAGAPFPGIYYMGWSQMTENPVVRGNLAYGTTPRLWTEASGGVSGAIVTDNYFPNGVAIAESGIVDDSNNFLGPIPESGTEIRLHADDYSTERAYLAVYNWDEADSVAVDVSAIFDAGDSLKLWAVQAGVDASGVQQDKTDYTVAGDGTITVDMRAVTHSAVAVPYQWTAPATTFPEFGVFVVTRV